MQDGGQGAVGVELNGHVWDGAQWVPVPPRPAPKGRQEGPPPGHSSAPPFQLWQRLPQPGGFTDPRYGYGLTQQTSDDLEFIARFVKIVLIVKIVLFVLGMVIVPLMFGSVLAALGSLLPHVSR